MKSIPLTLSITRSAGHSKNQPSQKDDQQAKRRDDLKAKIFERDDFVCNACGFRAEKYQAIHSLRGNDNDSNPDNYVTLCFFCDQCFHLDKVNDMRSGVLIWMPEISQSDLHHLARAIYVARISQGPVADVARRSLDLIMKRREEARGRIGTDDPYILATVLKDYISDKAYQNRVKKLEGLRLFPLDRRIIKEADLEFNQFPQILAYWRSKNGPFGGQLPRHWIDLYKEMEAKAG